MTITDALQEKIVFKSQLIDLLYLVDTLISDRKGHTRELPTDSDYKFLFSLKKDELLSFKRVLQDMQVTSVSTSLNFTEEYYSDLKKELQVRFSKKICFDVSEVENKPLYFQIDLLGHLLTIDYSAKVNDFIIEKYKYVSK